MNKKDLKFYEAPTLEVENLELQVILCTSSNVDDVKTEEPGDEY